MRHFIVKISFFAFLIFGIGNSFAQNELLPAKYHDLKYAVNTVADMDTFTEILSSINFINDSLKTHIEQLIVEEKVLCFLDILAQSEDAFTFYKDLSQTDYKKDFISKINNLRKHESLRKLDSVWFEYFRDTLNNARYVNQYSGFKLCMRSDNIILKERIYIPINNSGQFYKKHYYREMEKYISIALNNFLSTTNSPKRLAYYTNPLFRDEAKKELLNQDGVAFVFLNKKQVDFYNSNDYWNKYYKFGLFYTHFDNYNTNGQKAIDIEHIINANLMWYYDLPTQRSIIRIMKESYFENLKSMIHYAHVNATGFITTWGVYPDVYKDLVTDLVKHSRNRVHAEIIVDEYPKCNSDSFSFKVKANDNLYSGKYKCGKQLDFRFLKLLYDIVKDCIPGRIMYLASVDQVNLFYVLATEIERDYIINNNVFFLYDIESIK